MSNPSSSLLPCARSSSSGQAAVQSMDCDPGGISDTPASHDPYQFWAVTPPEGSMDMVVVSQPVRQHHHWRNAPTAEWGVKGLSTADLPQEKPPAARRHSHTATSATSLGTCPVPGYAIPQHEKIAQLQDHVSTSTEGGALQRWPNESGESPLSTTALGSTVVTKPLFTFPSDSFGGAPSSTYSSPPSSSSSSSAKGGYHHGVQTSCAGAVPNVATCIFNRDEGFGMVVSIDPGISNPDELPATGVSH